MVSPTTLRVYVVATGTGLQVNENVNLVAQKEDQGYPVWMVPRMFLGALLGYHGSK